MKSTFYYEDATYLVVQSSIRTVPEIIIRHKVNKFYMRKLIKTISYVLPTSIVVNSFCWLKENTLQHSIAPVS